MDSIENQNNNHLDTDWTIKGYIAAPLTGFNQDKTVNLSTVAPYAEMLKCGGVVGVFVNGTTGEGMSLTADERMELAELWVKQKADDFKVIIHVGYGEQTLGLQLAKHAVDIGADAIGEIGPMINQPSTVEALVAYSTRTAAAASALPYYYYHMPSLNNITFPMADYLACGANKIPNFQGIKYTYEDLDDYAKCVQFDHKRFDIAFGRDELLIKALPLGAQGGVGSTFNFMAPLYNELTCAFHAGDMDKAAALQNLSIAAIDLLVGTDNFFSALKTVVGHMGIDLGPVRDPQVNLQPAAKEKLLNDLQAIGAFAYLNNTISK